MKITAFLSNRSQFNEVTVATNGTVKSITIPPRATGQGSSVNGGELLMLALATCFVNDIYREAAKRNIEVTEVSVEVEGVFGAEGEPGRDFEYRPIIRSNADPERIRELIRDTDAVAEVHNTLRKSVPVRLKYD